MAAAPSFEDNDLKQVINSKATDYPSTSAQGLTLQLGAWSVLCEAKESGEWGAVHMHWQACLVPERALLTKRSTSESFIVLKSCEFAVLVWPAEQVIDGQLTYWRPSLADGCNCRWLSILNVNGFRVLQTKALPPHVTRALSTGNMKVHSGGIFAMQVRAPMSLYEASAYNGFEGVSGRCLDKMMRSEALFDRLPARQRTTLYKVETLVRHFLPTATDAEVADIMKARAGLDLPGLSSPLLMGGNLSHCEGVVESKDLQEARGYKKKHVSPAQGKAVSSLVFLKERKMISEADFDSFIAEAKGVIPAAAPHDGK